MPLPPPNRLKRLQLDEETINVRIPAGAKSGSRIRIKGNGRLSPFSHQREDLYLTIELFPHAFFQFSGDNLICEIPLRPDEAVLGVQIQVPTPESPVTMTIPKGLTLPRLKSVGFLRVQNLNLKGVVNSPPLTSLRFNLRVAATWFQDISSFLLLC